MQKMFSFEKYLASHLGIFSAGTCEWIKFSVCRFLGGERNLTVTGSRSLSVVAVVVEDVGESSLTLTL